MQGVSGAKTCQVYENEHKDGIHLIVGIYIKGLCKENFNPKPESTTHFTSMPLSNLRKWMKNKVVSTENAIG